MFSDKRSKKIVLVAHCILNQNAKIDRCAHYPGVITEVVHVFTEAGVGILQMPCPELMCLGLDRQVEPETPNTVESEDSRVAKRMQDEQTKATCRQMTNEIIYQVEEYQKNGFDVLGVVGINGSPTCGVETVWSNDQEEVGSGILIQYLKEECRQKEIILPMCGIKAYEPKQAVVTLKSIIKDVSQTNTTCS
jgi:predicted secreted protein